MDKDNKEANANPDANGNVAIEEDDQYRESDDEDFNPDNAQDNSGDESDNEGQDLQESKDEVDNKYKSIQGDGVESSVRTRSQRAIDELKGKEYKKIESDANSTLDVEDLWTQLNDPTATTKSASTDKSLSEEDYVVIQRRYQFAGKTTIEEKRVLASSAEAKAYRAEQNVTPAEDGVPAKKKPTKRKKSILEAELNAGKAQKMNTLQKSRLDWASFVDKEGIKDDLTKHNKGGYLHKQDFLSRVEHKLDQNIKQGLKKK